ncbi:hypothetical protein QNI16_15390 [Cytophagaceae bacterium YF14B1]|uniref:Uncharacterized protein n=1 Tax=Xanthocytophaga flava TaxID=3048013 RepID=A0AAE3QS71_9BACT|nr:hypothetical protein [Xanthocytophaga flavus]MDJ1481884.1 hypothetical protein [Xanthocytophaga flavus]
MEQDKKDALLKVRYEVQKQYREELHTQLVKEYYNSEGYWALLREHLRLLLPTRFFILYGYSGFVGQANRMLFRYFGHEHDILPIPLNEDGIFTEEEFILNQQKIDSNDQLLGLIYLSQEKWLQKFNFEILIESIDVFFRSLWDTEDRLQYCNNWFFTWKERELLYEKNISEYAKKLLGFIEIRKGIFEVSIQKDQRQLKKKVDYYEDLIDLFNSRQDGKKVLTHLESMHFIERNSNGEVRLVRDFVGTNEGIFIGALVIALDEARIYFRAKVKLSNAVIVFNRYFGSPLKETYAKELIRRVEASAYVYYSENPTLIP